eukprot:scaffold4730_cov109-Isochrysis_galbana.AAC.4
MKGGERVGDVEGEDRGSGKKYRSGRAADVLRACERVTVCAIGELPPAALAPPAPCPRHSCESALQAGGLQAEKKYSGRQGGRGRGAVCAPPVCHPFSLPHGHSRAPGTHPVLHGRAHDVCQDERLHQLLHAIHVALLPPRGTKRQHGHPGVGQLSTDQLHPPRRAVPEGVQQADANGHTARARLGRSLGKTDHLCDGRVGRQAEAHLQAQRRTDPELRAPPDSLERVLLLRQPRVGGRQPDHRLVGEGAQGQLEAGEPRADRGLAELRSADRWRVCERQLVEEEAVDALHVLAGLRVVVAAGKSPARPTSCCACTHKPSREDAGEHDSMCARET